MKNLLLLFAALFLLTTFVKAEETKKFDITDFVAVDVGWGMHLKVTQANDYSIEVRAEEKDFKYLKVEKEGNSLRIYIDKKNYRMDDDVYINITMPELTAISLHGGALANVKMDVSGKAFTGELSGGAQLRGELKCSDIDLSLSGGSQAALNGNAGDLSADGSGGSVFKLKEFAVRNVEAELSGGSVVFVRMNGKLNVDASGGSQVKYYGSASIGKMDFSGGAGVTEGD